MIKNFFYKNSFKKSNILQNKNLKKKFTKVVNDILIDIDTPNVIEGSNIVQAESELNEVVVNTG